jgi:hypothetical protein
LDDPANYGRIAHVVKDGVIVDRDRLPENPILTGRPEVRPLYFAHQECVITKSVML